jgi:hypothetical protein
MGRIKGLAFSHYNDCIGACLFGQNSTPQSKHPALCLLDKKNGHSTTTNNK